jgi:hypothetical protein
MVYDSVDSWGHRLCKHGCARAPWLALHLAGITVMNLVAVTEAELITARTPAAGSWFTIAGLADHRAEPPLPYEGFLD